MMAAALAVRQRGHEMVFVGDDAACRTAEPMGVEARTLPSEYDLGPHLVGAIRDAMQATSGDMAAAGPMIQERMAAWARHVASPVTEVIDDVHPDAAMTSLFGVEVFDAVSPACPWAVVNSTFCARCRRGHSARERIAGDACRWRRSSDDRRSHATNGCRSRKATH
jgi:hypothetical protein